MKTHELAKALNHLARVLRAGPNVDFEELTNLTTHVMPSRPPRQSREMSDKGAALALLAQISSYNKQELLDLVETLGIPIEVRKADAVRDILGKTLRFIQDNPETRERLVTSAVNREPGKASSLARALAILMNQP